MLPSMPGEANDQDLMLRYRDGDTQAFEELYGRHKGPLYRYLLRHTGNAANAEEVFQEVWIKVIRSRDGYRPLAKFTTWLYRIGHNCFIDHVRRQGRNALESRNETQPDELMAAHGNPESAAVLSESGEKLSRAISDLPPDQREAFLLRVEGGFGLNEIASITDAGRETVKSRLRYAMRKLREALEDNGHD